MEPVNIASSTLEAFRVTPPPITSTLTPDTPARPKTASSHVFRTDPKLQNRRNELISGFPKHIGEISVEDYFKHILPQLPSQLEKRHFIREVVKILDNNHTYDTASNRWKGFPNDPAQQTRHETEVFSPLADIFTAIVDAAQQVEPGLVPNFELVVDGNATPFSERGGDSRPDGFFKISNKLLEEMSMKCKALMEKDGWNLKDMPTGGTVLNQSKTKTDQLTAHAGKRTKKPPVPAVYEITVPQEFKKKQFTGDVENDIVKLLWNCWKILALDPCRRFTLGFTIENQFLCLWVLNRGTLLKTEPFDFLKNKNHVVQMFLSFAFSSAEDMGWDPTITFSHLDDKNKRQYNIIVEKHVYRTISTLSDFSADNPLGRGARVWKVQDAEGSTHVLKDLWLDIDRTEEHEIYKEIIKDVEKTAAPETQQQSKQIVMDRLLTPLEYCRVKILGKPDDTVSVMLRGYNSDVKKPNRVSLLSVSPAYPAEKQSVGPSYPGDQDHSQSKTPSDSESESEHDSDTLEAPEPRPQRIQNPKMVNTMGFRFYTQMYHYRIVFQEYATTIYDERNLANVLHAIKDILIALCLIHSAGWVHRDISGGNLYYYKERHAGILGDLEYAKRVNDDEPSNHTVRTGTPFFMASETLIGQYLFHTANQELSSTVPNLFMMINNEWNHDNNAQVQSTSNAELRPPFAHNALHDLESVWWVIVWVLLFNDDAARLSPQTTARQTLMNYAFPGQFDSLDRMSFFKDPKFQNLLPNSFSPVITVIESFSSKLHRAYEDLEKHYPQIESLIKVPGQQPLIHLNCISLFDHKLEKAISGVALVHVKRRAQDAHRSGQKRTSDHLEEQGGSNKKHHQ
ncbi:hypothetical protein F5880DRAFT_1613185 [Lentinula raphanica]|nr:hypothetical protein F5880DRAFT_1613185 [Lentinula raphanica]